MGKKILAVFVGTAVAVLLFLTLSVVGSETEYLVFGADKFVSTMYISYILLIGSIFVEVLTEADAKDVLIDLVVAWLIAMITIGYNSSKFGADWFNETSFYGLFKRIWLPIVAQMLFAGLFSSTVKKKVSEWGNK